MRLEATQKSDEYNVWLTDDDLIARLSSTCLTLRDEASERST